MFMCTRNYFEKFWKSTSIIAVITLRFFFFICNKRVLYYLYRLNSYESIKKEVWRFWVQIISYKDKKYEKLYIFYLKPQNLKDIFEPDFTFYFILEYKFKNN